MLIYDISCRYKVVNGWSYGQIFCVLSSRLGHDVLYCNAARPGICMDWHFTRMLKMLAYSHQFFVFFVFLEESVIQVHNF